MNTISNITSTSREILKLSDQNLKNIEYQETKIIEFFIQISHVENLNIQYYLRIAVWANSNYKKIAYSIDSRKKENEQSKLFIISADHDSCWRYMILENIFKSEKINTYNYLVVINSTYLSEGIVEKIESENLLFIDVLKRTAL